MTGKIRLDTFSIRQTEEGLTVGGTLAKALRVLINVEIARKKGKVRVRKN